MGAIYGIVGEASPAEIRAMGLRLEHRGGAERDWSPAGGVSFGTRAATRETRPAGVPIVFDGFLDNLGELKALLEWGPDEVAAADEAKIALALYRRFGLDGLERLSGHFALALWDDGSQNLILARDRYGARPIHYARAGGRWLFASEYKALLAIDDLPARPNPEAIQYLQRTKYNMADQTFLDGVFAVPPGHWVRLGGGQVERGRYWDAEVRIAPRSDDEHAEVLRATLLDCTRRQTERYDPIGVSLSGGLDSAVALAAIRHEWPERTVHTFSAGFGAEDRELVDAAAIARHFGTRHHEIVLHPEELPDLIEPVVWYLEDPAGREETAFLYVTSRLAREHVEILMSGYAADALFAGMPRHRLVQRALQFPWLRRPLEDFFDYTQAGRKPRSLSGGLLTRLYFRGRQWPAPRVIGAESEPPGKTLEARGEQPLSEYLRRCLLEDPSLESKVERLHSPFGLAFNAPFMDSKLVECAFSIPDRLKIHGKEQKHVLRRAFAGLLPTAVLQRGKTLQKLKHDLALSRVLDGLAGTYLGAEAVRERGLFEPDYVECLTRRGPDEAYSTERAYRIWTLVLTEAWARLFVDERGRVPESG